MTAIKFAALAASAGTEKLESFSDKLSTGLTVFALGMVTVFVVLAILWAILALFKVIFYRENKPEAAKAAPAPVAEEIFEPEESAEDDGALVAAITAAIAAYTANDTSFASGFRVVSFKRSEHTSSWNRNGK